MPALDTSLDTYLARPWTRHYQKGTPAAVEIPEKSVQRLFDEASERAPGKVAATVARGGRTGTASPGSPRVRSGPTGGPQMTRLAIIADDLSGALDTAAPFALRGLRSIVALSPAGIAAALRDNPDIVGVSTGSRDADPEAARAAVRQCLAGLPAVSLPVATLHGFPLGLSIVAGAGEDESLLALAVKIA